MAAQIGDGEVTEIKEEAIDKPSAKRKADAPSHRKDKTSRCLVDSSHVCALEAAFHHHFAVYSKDRKTVNQIIPSVVWKAVYSQYKRIFPNSKFQQESLKDRLREMIKEKKTENSAQLGTEKAVSQSEEVLIHLKSPDEYANGNDPRSRRFLIEEIPTALGSVANPSSSRSDVPPTWLPNALLASQEKQMVKVQMLQQKVPSTASLTTQFQDSSQKQDALLSAELAISLEKLNKHKIANLKSARDLGVISEEEFKEKVKTLLNL